MWTTLGFLAVVSTISVPAQQPTAPGPARTSAPRLLPGTKASAFTTIQGSALTAQSAALAHSPVRVRDARVGRVARNLYTDEHGQFVFRGLDPGSYVVELMSEQRTVLAASTLISVNAGETGSAIVRQPTELRPLDTLIGHAQAHAGAVSTAAAASGILTARVPGDDVSPR
ncbi:MAG: carboxypeptidase-like regulatory domain-containing protein [Vicinamibacterales bacterium]